MHAEQDLQPINDEGLPDTRMRHSPFFATLTLITGLIISFHLASTTAEQERARAQDRFQTLTQQTTQVIQEKLDRFTLLMSAGRGLVLNNADLPPDALNKRWHQMFESFDIDLANFSLVGLSFTRYLDAQNRDRFTASINQGNDSAFNIFPPPPANQPSLVVMHLVPASIEGRMRGYDLMSETKRREAATAAIRSHQPVLSRPLSLLPTDIHSLDYLQLLPVIDQTRPQDRFLGVVTIGFSMGTLVQSSLDNLQAPLRIQVIDPRESLQQASYDTHPQHSPPDAELMQTSELTIAGQSIQLRFANLDPDTSLMLTRQHDSATLISGISITLMLTLMLMFYIIARHQALQVSRRMASRAEEMYQRYRTLFVQSPEAIVVHVDGCVEMANPNAARLMGCTSPQELINRPVSELVHPDSQKAFQRRRHALHQGAQLEPTEQKLVRINGQAFTAEVSSSIINYKGQKAVQVMFRDISTEKRQRLEARIARVIAYNSSDAIMVTDAHGAIELVNPAFQAMTGYIEANVQGRTPDLLNSGQHDSAFFFELWSSLQERGHWSGDIINRTRDGRLYIQQTDIHALHDEHNQITHFVCLMSDVTEARNSLEQALESSSAPS
ncbi:CHASE domain-containing protein [Marinobacterium weihaiense]|uniref:PAS domain S-box protein n=1 Tax=Marinobacterium weihaiense TaxID=2851016 RepID=A0ABS6M7E2_9GAMM|nr:PAS domain S-box protein [Marinobacterium weihaiense]MBV0932100.1 PAS domain S-box protein [Marinobacterium weihaiense]